MNKKIMMTIGAMAIAAVLGLIFSQNLSVSAGPDLTREDIEEKVKSQYPGEITELELDEKGKNPVYEVEIVIEGKEYELLIDGNSGEVLKLDEKLMAATDKESTEVKSKTETDTEKKTDVAESAKKEGESLQVKEKVANVDDKDEKKSSESKSKDNNQSKVTAPTNKEDNKNKKSEDKAVEKESKSKKSIITTQEAIDIALKQFSGEVNGIELDSDDGRLIYEIEMESSRGEAEIEIDAYTGEVLVVDIDLEDD